MIVESLRGLLPGLRVEFDFVFDFPALAGDRFVEFLQHAECLVLRRHQSDEQVLPDRHAVADPTDVSRPNDRQNRQDGG